MFTFSRAVYLFISLYRDNLKINTLDKPGPIDREIYFQFEIEGKANLLLKHRPFYKKNSVFLHLCEEAQQGKKILVSSLNPTLLDIDKQNIFSHTSFSPEETIIIVLAFYWYFGERHGILIKINNCDSMSK